MFLSVRFLGFAGSPAKQSVQSLPASPVAQDSRAKCLKTMLDGDPLPSMLAEMQIGFC